ncbi:hypothetical protein QN277_028501 [Acacia crassicarpa]|uniref:Secreted protein n=1 Tax=Acacia crassicarpa TaxID=499986 RepID=A0AAE1MF73_9FABA|nr:hypothetical protein QN277_028501 [Acacia crassicarpa]
MTMLWLLSWSPSTLKFSVASDCGVCNLIIMLTGTGLFERIACLLLSNLTSYFPTNSLTVRLHYTFSTISCQNVLSGSVKHYYLVGQKKPCLSFVGHTVTSNGTVGNT